MEEEMQNEEVMPNEVEEVAPAPLGKTAEKKPEGEKAVHAVAAAAKDAPMLELVLPVGMEIELNKVPMVVTKVDGMTVSLKRTDIVG